MTTIIMNQSILSNEDLAQMAREALEANEMPEGLWAIRIDQYAMFDCSNMERVFDATRHNAIVNVVASTQELNSSNDPDYRDDCLLGYPPVEPEWLPSPEEIDEIAKTPDAAAPTEDPSSGWVALRDEPTEPPREW